MGRGKTYRTSKGVVRVTRVKGGGVVITDAKGNILRAKVGAK